MGLNDFYPFVLSDAALTKLRFVHDIVGGQATEAPRSVAPGSRDLPLPSRHEEAGA
jgi:hypothetical protein